MTNGQKKCKVTWRKQKIFNQNPKNMELKRREKTENTISKYGKCI